VEDQDENRIRELEKQIATLREDLAKKDEQIAMLENLLKQQQGLGRGGI
jgi:predicted RNase H-like nuclease (RuvC/YqgF family)